MTSIFIRSLTADGVSVERKDNNLRITINGKEELRAEKAGEMWSVWDQGQCVSFDNFKEVWNHIEDLADHYDLFPIQWKDEHYEMVKTLFRGVE